jgi:hypothetical protein
MEVKDLFWELYRCQVEGEVHKVLEKHGLLEAPGNWRPYGGTENNFGVVENQQASPIPALVEKLTNGIDAIMEKRCIEEGICPKSPEAPRSIEEGIATFFPDSANWDLSAARREQAEDIQVIADGPFETRDKERSLIIYDNGVGQAPESFEDTFLSLLNGNKNEIHFVQGKYNMGGAGAVAFCGKHRFHLIGSKRHDGASNFGFTLVRKHPLSKEEEKTKKNTWYEYLVIDDKIPSFASDEMDLGLYNRSFQTGTVIKLYSYDLPAGSRSVISRDLNQSINEYLFSPALPLFTIDTKERYPHDINLERHLFGLKRRLEEVDSKYVETAFSEEINEKALGKVPVTCYVFHPRTDGKTVKETRDTISREFFKNNMSVLFTMNGQVHGGYTSEFITRTLKFPLLKNHLLIHVDCTDVSYEVRNELFMASRDRLKDGEESRELRRRLGQLLGQGRLKKINKDRKDALSVGSGDAEEMLRNITRNLPIKDDLAKLLNQTFKLEDKRRGKKPKPKKKENSTKKNDQEPVFDPQRFPSTFKIKEKTKSEDGIPMFKLPLGGNRIIKFSTDVEDQYFDRIIEPGELRIGLLRPTTNSTGGGDRPGEPKDIQDLLNVVKSSPSDGVIRVHVNATEELKVGDAVSIRAELSSPNGSLEQVFLVKVTAPEKKKKTEKPGDDPDERLGLPTPIMVFKEPREEGAKSSLTWEALEAEGVSMDHDVVVVPLADDDGLSKIFINMDSSAHLNFRSKLSTPDAIIVAEKRYFSAVYFHTLFLYAISKNRKYNFSREVDGDTDEPTDLTEYISDLFRTSYAQFLLSFDTQELVNALEA